MDKIVSGCGDCPFAGFVSKGETWRCLHPTSHCRSIAEIEEELITPDWCPLKKEPITISIKLP